MTTTTDNLRRKYHALIEAVHCMETNADNVHEDALQTLRDMRAKAREDLNNWIGSSQ